MPQLAQQVSSIPYAKEIPIASGDNVTSKSLPATARVSQNLKQVLDRGDLTLKVDRIINLGETETAVFSVMYQAHDSSGKKIGEAVPLRPPVIVEKLGDETYNSRKQELLISALEKHAVNLPHSIILTKDSKQIPLIVERKDSPALWEELKKGAKVEVEVIKKSTPNDDYSVTSIKLISFDGIHSNQFAIYNQHLDKSLRMFEFEAKRISDLRSEPSKVLESRTRYIGDRGIVMSQKGITVLGNSELGDYYCEAMMFAPQYMAEYEKGCSILKNKKGEPLNGFIHIPGDSLCDKTYKVAPTDQQLLARHSEHSSVIARALLGYVQQAAQVTPNLDQLKVMLTGYSGFVNNNPSGEFVVSRAVLEETLKKAFGDNLKSVEFSTEGESQVRMKVNLILFSKNFNLEIVGASYPLDPKSLDYGGSSVQTLIRKEKPQIFIGMGVRPGRDSEEKTYDVGMKCDNGLIIRNSSLREVFGQTQELALPPNDSLSSAIYSGDQILKVRNGSK